MNSNTTATSADTDIFRSSQTPRSSRLASTLPRLIAPSGPSLGSAERLELPRHRAGPELVVRSEGVLARLPPGDAAVDDAVEQRVAAKPVVPVHAASDLTRSVKPRDGLAPSNNLGLWGDLQAAHTVVDHWGDDGHVELFRRELVAVDDVLEELLAAARRAAGLVPGLAVGVRGERAPIWVPLGVLSRGEVLVVRLHQGLQGDADVLRELGAICVVLHHATAGVVLAMPDDLGGGGFVQAQPEGRLVLPHLASHVVSAAELVSKALAVGVDDNASHAPQRLRRQELHLRVGVVWFHQARRVHLHPLQVDSRGADLLAHLDGVARAVLAIRGGEVQ